MIYKTLHRKLTIKHHKPHKYVVELRRSWRGKKSLKIPKELSESVNRRTDNTMDKKQKTKQTQQKVQNGLQDLHIN